MTSVPAYSLQIAPRDEADVGAELKTLEASNPKALGRLLRVLREIVDRGDKAREDNPVGFTLVPALHVVTVGAVVGCYAYGLDNGVYLLSVGRRGAQEKTIELAVARIVNVPPEV
jgi:hypothetical protein